jgi:hypothetical protein
MAPPGNLSPRNTEISISMAPSVAKVLLPPVLIVTILAVIAITVNRLVLG